MLKSLFTILVIVGIIPISNAQILSYFTQYETNNALFFPAQSAQITQKQINITSRRNTIQESILNQQLFSFQMPFNKNRSGLNFNLYSNSKNNEVYNSINVGYAHKVNFYGGYLSLATAYLLQNTYLSQLLIKDANDENAPANGFSNWKSDINISLMYKSKKMQLALATENILKHNENIFYYNPQLNYYFSAIYKIRMAEKLTISPFLFARINGNNNNVTDAMLRLQYNQKINLGIGFRTNQSLLFTTDILLNSLIKKIPNTLVFNYAYDNSLSKQSYAAHEFGLRYLFGNPFSSSKVNLQPVQYSPIFF